MLNYNVFSLVQSEMRPREKLIWTDVPSPIHEARSKTMTALFGIFFTGFAVFWVYGASGGMASFETDGEIDLVSTLFPLFGIPFVLAGLGMLLSPVWTYLKARSTCYGLSNQRALIIRNWPRKRIDSYGPAEMNTLTRADHGNGNGTIIFREEVSTRWTRSGTSTDRKRIGFYGIKDARRVEGEIAKLKDQPGSSR